MREAGIECLRLFHFEGFKSREVVKLLPQDSFCSSCVGVASSFFTMLHCLLCILDNQWFVLPKTEQKTKDLYMYDDQYAGIEHSFLLTIAIWSVSFQEERSYIISWGKVQVDVSRGKPSMIPKGHTVPRGTILPSE